MTNTTDSIAKGKQKTNAELAADTKKALEKMKGGKQVKVSIPAILANQLTKNLFVCVNDVHIYIPVDGEEHSVPEAHAKVVKEMLKNLK